jgi:hypothetical protein
MIVEVSSGGERRSGSDRRRFTYDRHLPERRHGLERRERVQPGRKNGGRTRDGYKGIERRKLPRLRVREGAYVALCPHYDRVGQIVDISTDGLAFTYVATTNGDDESAELDIFLVKGDFYLEQIPFVAVTDIGIAPHSPFASVVTRRKSLRFGRLSPSQRSRLEFFIDRYTHHPKEERT